MDKTILLSAGHSLSDPGAVAGTTKESVIAMKLVELASPMLRAHGIGVLNVPDNLDLVQTIKYVNDRATQITAAIEVHINAGGGKGVEGWFYHNFNNNTSDPDSKKLMQCILDALVAETGMTSRGAKDESTNQWGKLGFVHDTEPLAVLVECGFIDNLDDFKLMTSGDGQIKIAKGVVRGIVTYLGVAWQPNLINYNPSTGTTTPSDDKDKQIEALKKSLETANKQREADVALVKSECQRRLEDIKTMLQDAVKKCTL